MKPSLTPIFQTRKSIYLLNGYTIIRKDRNRNGGGIAIYMKNNISHFERVDLTLDSGNLELISIEINRDYIVDPSYLDIPISQAHLQQIFILLKKFLTGVTTAHSVLYSYSSQQQSKNSQYVLSENQPAVLLVCRA